MSAWIVSKTHIDLLITAALAWELIVQEGADEAGRMLWSECQKSVAFCYPGDKDGEWPGPLDLTLADIQAYTFEAIEGRVDPDIVHFAARSLDYQSCEHPGWQTSRAYLLCNHVIEAAEAMVDRYRQRWGEAPENELAYGPEGAWSADSRTILLHAEKLREDGRRRSVVEG